MAVVGAGGGGVPAGPNATEIQGSPLNEVGGGGSGAQGPMYGKPQELMNTQWQQQAQVLGQMQEPNGGWYSVPPPPGQPVELSELPEGIRRKPLG